MNTKIIEQTQQIIDKAFALGFSDVGISEAQPLIEERKKLEHWLSKGYHGTMSYMERYIEQRTFPTLLVPNAKSVITLLLNYYPAKKQNSNAPKISKYAYGKDYHHIIKEKLVELLQFIETQHGAIAGRGFVDSAPLFERALAVKSGLGWIGKNGNLILKKKGSFFFIANLLIDIPLHFTNPKPITDHCGTCKKCIEVCPTQAILPNKIVNATQCISYYTIELKAVLKDKHNPLPLNDWMFGCDVCQDVCPWNKFSTPTKDAALEPYAEIINFEIKDWLNLNEEQFKKLFSKSPLKRTKHAGIQFNLTQAEQC